MILGDIAIRVVKTSVQCWVRVRSGWSVQSRNTTLCKTTAAVRRKSDQVGKAAFMLDSRNRPVESCLPYQTNKFAYVNKSRLLDLTGANNSVVARFP